MGDRERPQPTGGFLLTFIPEHDRPSDEQLTAIGRITTTWSVLERILGILLARLALAPEYPAMALTKDLGLDNQIKAVKTLLSLHADRYEQNIVNEDLEGIITNMLSKFAKLKERRNVLSHGIWFRMGDNLSSLRSRPITARVASTQSPLADWTVPEMENLAWDIQELADAMFVVTQLLPAVDEGQHVKSQLPKVRHLPPETRKAPEGPPQSSEA